jgi:tRNA A-37 threonylcarbamoyl transferase component Bud32
MGWFKKIVRKVFGGGHKHVHHHIDNSAQLFQEAQRKAKEDFDRQIQQLQHKDALDRQRIEAQLREEMQRKVEQEFTRLVQIREADLKRIEDELRAEQELEQEEFREAAKSLELKLGQHCIQYEELQFNLTKDQIASGASGTVYKGKYKDVYVAIKIYHEEVQSADAIRELNHEVNIIKKLDHANIVKFVGITVHPQISLVMEYVDGHDLNKYLHFKKKMFTEREAVSVLHQIGLSLEYLHSQDIIHGDIKSANIVRYGDNKMKLTDFGISKVLNKQSSTNTLMTSNHRTTSTRYGMGIMSSGTAHSHNTLHTLQRVGTPVYMAPGKSVLFCDIQSNS